MSAIGFVCVDCGENFEGDPKKVASRSIAQSFDEYKFVFMCPECAPATASREAEEEMQA